MTKKLLDGFCMTLTPTHLPTYPCHPSFNPLPSPQHLPFCSLPQYPHLPISESVYVLFLNTFTVTSCIMVMCVLCKHLFSFISRTRFSLGKQVLWLTCVPILLHNIMSRCVHHSERWVNLEGGLNQPSLYTKYRLYVCRYVHTKKYVTLYLYLSVFRFLGCIYVHKSASIYICMYVSRHSQ